MTTFLKAAFEVLSREKRPLSPEEITRIALELGILKTSGKTPANSMKARLATDILRNKELSKFMRADSGSFGLREWGQPEYIAQRFVPALFDEDVVVFPTEKLFDHIDRIGITRRKVNTRRLLADCFSMRRKDAELTYDVIQLITLFIVRHQDKLLTHKRTKRLPEARLHGFYSVTFGGHLNPQDIGSFQPLFDPFDPEQLCLGERELREELRLSSLKDICYAGMIYDDSRDVSRQHLGIIFDVFAATNEFQIGERGFLTDAKYETIPELIQRLNDFENWSQMIILDEAK